MVNLLLTNSYLPLVEFKILKSDAKPFQGQSRLFKVDIWNIGKVHGMLIHNSKNQS